MASLSRTDRSDCAREHQCHRCAEGSRRSRCAEAPRHVGLQRNRSAAGSSGTNSGSSARPAGGVQPGNFERVQSMTARRCRSTEQRFRAAKLSWQMSQQNKITGFYHRLSISRDEAASQFSPAESMRDHRWTGLHAQDRVANGAGQLAGGVAAVRELVQARVLLCAAGL